MKIEEIKKALLEDRDFREKLFKLYFEDDERFLNRIIMKIDGEKVGKQITPSISKTLKNAGI